MPARSSGGRRHLREIALRTVQESKEGLPPRTPGGHGLNIRTSVNLTTMPYPKPIPEQFREKIREIAKRDAKEPFRQPYVTLQDQSADRYLPVVTANLCLEALDGEDNDLECQLNSVEMFWDTGAHRTIITEEILPVEFREYLKDPIHEPYRLSHGLFVQIDGTIAFTNRAMPITAPVMVIPKEHMPNQFVGILFGQCLCIDRLVYHSIPREILKAKGDIIPEDRWGDIIVTEYLAQGGEMVAL